MLIGETLNRRLRQIEFASKDTSFHARFWSSGTLVKSTHKDKYRPKEGLHAAL